MKLKLSISLLFFFLAVSLAKADTVVFPHLLEVSAGVIPGSPVYFLDGFAEWVSLKLTFNPVKKAEKKIKYASERLAELETLRNTNKLDQEKAEKIKEKYQIATEDVSADIDNLKAKGQDVADLVQKIEAIAVRQTAVLEGVLEKAPEQAREAIMKAIEVSKRGHERAIEAIQKEIEEGGIEIEELEEDLKEEIEERKRGREEEREMEREMRPGAKIQELEIEDDEDEIEDLTKEIDENGLKDLDSDLDLIEKSIR